MNYIILLSLILVRRKQGFRKVNFQRSHHRTENSSLGPAEDETL